jgi:hypothetical protein
MSNPCRFVSSTVVLLGFASAVAVVSASTACQDDPTYRHWDNPNNDCAWIAANGDMCDWTSDGVPLGEKYCPVACGVCDEVEEDSVSVNQKCGEHYDSIVVTFGNTNPMQGDWIGIYESEHATDGELGDDMVDWSFVCNEQLDRNCLASSGTITFDGLSDGTYLAFLLRDGWTPPYEAIVGSAEFTIDSTAATTTCPEDDPTYGDPPAAAAYEVVTPTLHPTLVPYMDPPAAYHTPPHSDEPTVSPGPTVTAEPTATPGPTVTTEPTSGPTSGPTQVEPTSGPTSGPTQGPTDLGQCTSDSVATDETCYELKGDEDDIVIEFDNCEDPQDDDFLAITRDNVNPNSIKGGTDDIVFWVYLGSGTKTMDGPSAGGEITVENDDIDHLKSNKRYQVHLIRSSSGGPLGPYSAYASSASFLLAKKHCSR